jgi:hypothetical protein
MSVTTVRNHKEAVELAQELRRSGVSYWFRGQAHNSAVLPTLARLDDAARAKALERLDGFHGWVHDTPGLQAIAANDAFVTAVAQHYGIATTFLDFTTDPNVAGIFARPKPSDIGKSVGCIVYFDTAEFDEVIQCVPNGQSYAQRLVLDVPNLWRLQAQSGVFVFLPTINFKAIFNFDRIEFPQNGPWADDEIEIYPKNKSDLEKLLDQYFFLEGMGGRESAKKLETFTRINYLVETPSNDVPILASWIAASDTRWIEGAFPPENLLELDRRSFAVDAPSHTGIREFRDALLAALQAFLRTQRDVRSCLLDFTNLKSPEACRIYERMTVMGAIQFNIDNVPVSAGLTRIWDGMRRLPWSDLEISSALANYAAIRCFQDQHDVLFGPCIDVEYTTFDGSYSRSFVSTDSLRRELRADMPDYIDTKSLGLTDAPENIFWHVRDPKRLFEFQSFRKLLADEIIPFEEYIRSTSYPRFYSPARIEKLGLP